MTVIGRQYACTRVELWCLFLLRGGQDDTTLCLLSGALIVVFATLDNLDELEIVEHPALYRCLLPHLLQLSPQSHHSNEWSNSIYTPNVYSKTKRLPQI